MSRGEGTSRIERASRSSFGTAWVSSEHVIAYAGQREGIAKARVEGKHKGRGRTALANAGEVEASAAKDTNPTEVVRSRDRPK